MIDIRKKIGIIGYGNMGSAIAQKLALLKNHTFYLNVMSLCNLLADLLLT